MNYKSKLFSIITAIIAVVAIGAFSNAFAQSKTSFVGANGTVYANYRGAGEIADKSQNEPEDAYCYQCRAFHKNVVYSYYNNRENCNNCTEHAHKHKYSDKCSDCREYRPIYYDIDHEFDHCNDDYIVKYRNNKVKVRCNSCNAKWKYYYNDYNSNVHYVYDNDDRVIVSYQR